MINARSVPPALFRIQRDNSTGPFVGFGSYIGDSKVLLHPAAAHAVLRSRSTSEIRLRVQFAGSSDRSVLDGSMYQGPGSTAGPLVIAMLDYDSDSAAESVGWTTQAGAEQNLREVEAFLDGRDQGDPTTPPAPSPTPPWRPDHSMPGINPPWCLIWPRCPGC